MTARRSFFGSLRPSHPRCVARGGGPLGSWAFLGVAAFLLIARPAHSHQIVLTFDPTGQTYEIGDTLRVTWEMTADRISDVEIEVSVDGGKSWFVVHDAEAISNSSPEWLDYPWVIPDSLGGVSMVSEECLIKIIEYEDKLFLGPVITGTFTIAEPTPEPPATSSEDTGKGCGAGAVAALLPPIGFRLFKRRGKKR